MGRPASCRAHDRDLNDVLAAPVAPRAELAAMPASRVRAGAGGTDPAGAPITSTTRPDRDIVSSASVWMSTGTFQR